MQDSIPQFGKVARGQKHRLREGGYGIVHDDSGCIAVIRAHRGAFLPGGELRHGESPQQALIRRAREECRLDITVDDYVGIADEMVVNREKQACFRKRCTFFTAHASSGSGAASIHADRTLVWLPVAEAIQELLYESQRWAVQTASSEPQPNDQTPGGAG